MTRTTLRGLVSVASLVALRGYTLSSEARRALPFASHRERQVITAQAMREDVQATMPASRANWAFYRSSLRGLGDVAPPGSLENPLEGEGERHDDTGLGPDGWPASPGFRPGNWEGGRPTAGRPRYMLASGDTLSGLATCYLGGPQRWREIWEAGGNREKYESPDKLPAGAWLDMPKEALDGAIALMGDPNEPRKPASPGAPGSVPGASDPADEPFGSWSPGTKLAVAGGVLGVLGLAYVATR